MAGATRRDRTSNEIIHRRMSVEMEITCRVDESILRWFGHSEEWM